MTEFALVVKRISIFEFQIAEVGNIGIVDEILQSEGCPLQAVLLGKAIFIRREIWHSVFDVDEDGAEQNAQGCADQGDWNEEGDEVGKDGGKGCFHGFSFIMSLRGAFLLLRRSNLQYGDSVDDFAE